MVQVMLVGSWLDTFGSPGAALDFEGAIDRCERALASALAALEESTGRKREDFGGDHYACRERRIFAEDLAAA